MRRFWGGFCFFALFSCLGFAQERDKPRTNYFFFAAPGVRHDTGSSTVGIGGGAEGYVYRGLGFGFDAGGINSSSTTGVRNWSGMLSLNCILNFNPADKSKFSPFVIGGLTLIPSFDVASGYNFGGGVQYWFQKHIALRVEFRDHVLNGMHNHHYPQGRIGISLRR
jgi:hypothetical protein